MELQKIIPEQASQIIASYDFFDFASNVGYKTFYGFNDVSGSYALTTNTIYSEDIYSSITNGEELIFDITFNRPVDVAAADAIINYQFGFVTADTSEQRDFTATFTVYHYDGTTETSLGSVIVDIAEGLQGNNWGYPLATSCGIVALTQKHFSPGNTLRLKLTMSESTGGTPKICHDPANRTATFSGSSGSGNAQFSTLSIDVPFEVLE